METELILEIAVALMTLCAGGFGVKYRKFKCKWNEFMDVMVAIDELINDDNDDGITVKEIEKVIKEVSDLKA